MYFSSFFFCLKEDKLIWRKNYSIIGFLLGVTAAGSAGYYYLLGEYNNASEALMLSVQELQASTDKVRYSLNK